MDDPRDYYAKRSQKEKDRYHMLSPICGVFKKGTNELICKTEIEVPM